MPRRAGCGGSSRPTSPTWPACRRSSTASSGLALFVRAFGIKALALGPTLLAGVLTLSLLILPIIVITTQEALRAVPQSLRQAALALGATRWQVVRDHVLPSALPGILTGTILGLSRAIGETAPLLMVGAAGSILRLPRGPARPLLGPAGRDLQLRQGAGPRVPDRRRRRHPDPGGALARDERHRHRDPQPYQALSLERFAMTRDSQPARPSMSVSETRAETIDDRPDDPPGGGARPPPRPARHRPDRALRPAASRSGTARRWRSRRSRSTSPATRSPP